MATVILNCLRAADGLKIRSADTPDLSGAIPLDPAACWSDAMLQQTRVKDYNYEQYFFISK